MSGVIPGGVKRITSLQNPIIKAVRALHQRKARAESGLFLAEGHKLVRDALEVGWAPTMMVALEPGAAERQGPGGDSAVEALAAKVRAAGGDIIWTGASVLEKVARRDNPQTVLGVFEQRFEPAATMTSGTVVALEGPRDPGNIGTVIRTADALGATGVVLVGASADPFGVDAVRATMGSVFHVPLARLDAAGFEGFARRFPGPVIGTHLAGTADIRTLTPQEPQMLVMGTEQAGLSDAVAALCDPLVRIPMAGGADSLNLAVATAIGLFELRRNAL